MKDKKTIIIAIVILLLVLVGAVGASYAYFATATKTSGNEKNLNIVTEDLGNIKWEGTKVFESDNLLPGECGIQTFTIEKNSASGKGIYEIDLKGIIDSVFNDDVEISLYKSTNPTTDNVTITEGNSATDAGADNKVHYYKEDTLTINGSPKKVYGPKALKNKNPIILEQADFDNSRLQKTTYYLVYHYKNADTIQDAQQGKSFSGEINVKLILEKSDQCKLDDSTAACSIIAKAKTDTTNLATDEAGNTRYIGADPNNYISIDGEEYTSDIYYGYWSSTSPIYHEYSSLEECTNDPDYNVNCKLGKTKGTPILWRIIGVMKDIDDGTGKKENRIKLIRNESIGEYSWDTIESSINYGDGVNEWSQADLMKLLNPGYESETIGGSLYWNSGSGTCYYEQNNGTTSCDFTSTGIKDKLKTLIGDAVWNTGSNGTNYYTSASGGLTKNFYTYERSDDTGKICTSSDFCNDTVERTTTWKGLVGLAYPSDFGYATSGGSTKDRATCLNKNLRDWGDYYMRDCYNNDWLFDNSFEWTLTPSAYSIYARYAFYMQLTHVSDNSVCNNNGVRPTVYLTSNVKISSGKGSQDDPFTLES
mgnify:FL=1